MKIFYSNFFRRFFPGRISPLLEKTKTEKEEGEEKESVKNMSRENTTREKYLS